MEYTDFDDDFIKRTIKILQSYKKINGEKYEVTLLINCLTGLLILPKEKHYNQIPDDNIKDLQGWGIKQDHIIKVRCSSCGYKLNNIVRHMRNSIAHMKVKAKSDGGEIVSLRFNDSGFIAEIPIDSLEEFVKKLARTVINDTASN